MQHLRKRRRRSRSFSFRDLLPTKPKRPAPRQPLHLETLEGRVLLTTLIGGDVFEFIDADEETIRIATDGELIVEIIAADIDDQNNIIFSDVPGTFLASDLDRTGTDVLGGRGGEDGVTPVNLSDFGAPITISDPDFPALSIFGNALEGSDNINISAIASRDEVAEGETYGFNFGVVEAPEGDDTTEDQTVIQLVQMDAPDFTGDDQLSGFSEVRAMIQQATLREDVTADLDQFLGGVEAFSADPTNPGSAYAIDADGTLFLVGLFDGSVQQIGEINQGGAQIDDVRASAFDGAGNLFILADGDLLRINKTTGDVEQREELNRGPYTGMVFDADGTILATREVFDEEGTAFEATFLDRITRGGAAATAVQIGQIGELRIDGIAFALDAQDERILVGIDTSERDEDTGQVRARLTRIGLGNGAPTLLSTAGTVATVFDLTSVAEGPESRPLLFATDGGRVLRGSAVSLETGADSGEPLAESVLAADFRPVTGDPEDGLLYFVAQIGPQEGEEQEGTADQLFSVDITAGDRSAIQNSIRLMGTIPDFTEGNAADVTSIAWERIPGAGVALWGFQTGGASIGEEGTGRMIRIDPETAGIVQSIGVSRGGEAVTDITGIEFVRDDPNDIEEFFIATRPDEIVQIRRSTGTVFSLGPLPDPDDTEDPIRGADIQGLTFNPTLRSPFTGEIGVLLATDATADEFVFIDERARFATGDIYAIYVAQGGVDASISIAVVPDFDPENPTAERDMIPFGGNAPQFRVIPAQGGQLIVVSADGNSGGVLIGAVTEDVSEDPFDDLLPITDANIARFFDEEGIGVRPVGLDDLPDDEDNDISAGIRVVESLVRFVSSAEDIGDRTMGRNLDRITNLSVAADGTVVVVDSDALDDSGEETGGDQVAIVNPNTGVAGAPVTVTVPDPLTGLPVPIASVQGLDFGDPDQDAVEELFAIIGNPNLPPTLGILNPVTGQFQQIGFVGGVVEVVDAMAFSPDQRLFVIGAPDPDAPRELFEIDPNTGARIRTVGIVRERIGSMDFDRRGVLFGHDLFNGRLVDINFTASDPSGDVVIGERVATTDGSLRPTIGAIGYDSRLDRFLGADNVTGLLVLGDEDGSDESASLVELLGTTSDAGVGQIVARLLIGGTLTGRVNSAGSFGLFYTGWLVTGQTGGQFEGPPEVLDNFIVEGDIRDLVVSDSIGTDGNATDEPAYMTGFDMQVGGKIGQVFTLADWIGFIDVEDNTQTDDLDAFTFDQLEVEGRDRRDLAIISEGDLFEIFELDRFDNSFLNDTFDTAQRVGTIRAGIEGLPDVVRVSGTLDGGPAGTLPNDNVDYYSLALMAGQTVTVQLGSLDAFFGEGDIDVITSGLLFVGVFDPDGNLQYSSYSHAAGGLEELPFRFTADRPGEWRFAIGGEGDSNFNGVVDGNESLIVFPFGDYLLSVNGAEDVALGGVRVDGNFFALSGGFFIDEDGEVVGDFETPSIVVRRGDLGALRVGARVFSEGFGFTNLLVENGRLRSLEADSIGRLGATLIDERPIGVSASGDIGLIRARGAVADLQGVVSLDANSNLQALGGGITTGGDLQVIDATTGALIFDLMADGGLGNVRAVDLNIYDENPIVFQTFVTLNADDVGRDGTLDLIDIGDEAHMPDIDTGLGGNVRYARVGGSLFESSRFGGDEKEELHNPGETVSFIDDGGATVRLSPTLLGNEPIDPLTGEVTNNNALITRSFGIANGGRVLVDVRSTSGVTVRADKSANGNAAEVGTIFTGGAGRAVITDPQTGELSLDPAGTTDLRVIVGNTEGEDGPIDVFNIVGGAFTTIHNQTGGEIAGVDAASIGDLFSRGSLGLTTTQGTGAAVVARNEPRFDPQFPLSQQTTGIISGDIVEAQARQGIGNFLVTGSIGRLVANNDQADDTTRFEGINGPIVVLDPDFSFTPDPDDDGGEITTGNRGNVGLVNIGEGVLPSGSGNLARAGLFAQGIINRVTNSGNPGADIRGDIVAARGINAIDLTDGSIIGSEIYVAIDFRVSAEFPQSFFFTDPIEDTFEDPLFEIKNVTLTGNGGIIGTDFFASDLGNFTVNRGFGIVNSFFELGADGVIGNVTVDGLGLRAVTFEGGARQGNITATGRGELLDVLNFDDDVRFSETREFDPFTGRAISIVTDLHEFLGTSVDEPVIADVTNSGILDNLDARGSFDVGTISGFRIEGITGPTLINFANRIAAIRTIDTIEDLELSTGRLDKFLPGSDVLSTNLSIAGPVKTINIRGDFAGDSTLRVTGPNSFLKSLVVAGDFDGSLEVAGRTGKVSIGGDLVGNVFIDGSRTASLALGSLTLGGSLGEGSLRIIGDVGTINAAGNLGTPGNVNAEVENLLVIEGDLNSLVVGSQPEQFPGSELALDLIVLGDLNSAVVTGRVTGDVLVSGNLRSMRITADPETGRNADPIPSGSIGGLLDEGGATDFDVFAVASQGGVLFAVNRDDQGDEDASNDAFDLLRFNRQPNGRLVETGATVSTLIDDLSFGGQAIQNIAVVESGLDAAGLPVLFVVGTAVGVGNEDDLSLFTIDPASGAVVGGVPIAEGPTRFNAANGFSVRGLAYDDRGTPLPGDDVLFAAIHNANTVPFQEDRLFTIGITDGAATLRGKILSDGIDTDIAGMDFVDREGVRQLVAIHNDPAIAGDAHAIVIDTANPGSSRSISAPGSVNENLRGFTADPEGVSFAVNDGSVIGQNQLFQSNFDLLSGRLGVGGDLLALSLDGGNLSGDVTAGHDIARIDVVDGDITAVSHIAAALGDIDSVTIRNGDLFGSIAAALGHVGTVSVTDGSDFGGSISGESAGTIRFDGSMLDGSEIDIGSALDSLSVGQDVLAGAAIAAGAADSIDIEDDFLGDLFVGRSIGETSLTIGGDYAGTGRIQADATLAVEGDFGRHDGTLDAASLMIHGDASNVQVAGNLSGVLGINGAAGAITAGSVGGTDTDTVITSGFDLASFTVTNDVVRTLLLVGASSGADLSFGTRDSGETARMADLGNFRARGVSSSVIAAGRDIGGFALTGAMADSSVSSGLVFDRDLIPTLVGDGLNLDSDANRNTLRTGGTLFHGDFNSLNIASGMSASAASAGVDPGADGVFGNADDSVITSLTGGASRFNSVNATGGVIVADAAGGGATTVGYSVGGEGGTDDIVNGDLATANPLETAAGFSSQAFGPIIRPVGGGNITISLSGQGRVDVFDDPATADRIDTLVLRGTDSSSRLTITSSDPDAIAIGRILTEDESTLGTLSSNTDVLGETGNTADPDLWIDGPVGTFEIRDLSESAGFDGNIGGPVNTMSIQTQGPGTLFVGGEINSLSLVDSTGVSLLQTLSIAPAGQFSETLRALAVDAAGNGFVFDEALGLSQVTLDPDPTSESEGAEIISGPVEVRDVFTEALLRLDGMDIAAPDQLLAVAELVNTQPTVAVGPLSPEGISLGSLAVDNSQDLDGDGDPDDRVFAIQNSNYFDRGSLLNDFDNIVDLVVLNPGEDDEQILLINANDNDTPLDATDDFAELVRVNVGANGVVVSVEEPVGPIRDAAGNVMQIDSLDQDPLTGTLHVVGTSPATGGVQRLYTFNRETAVATPVGDLFKVPPPPAPPPPGLFITPTLNAQAIRDALLSQGSGLNVTNITVNGHASGTATSAGTFTNPGETYNVDDGIVISTGNVEDYQAGPNVSNNNTFGYGVPATGAQEALLDPITGGEFDHFDVTQIDVEFTLEPGFNDVLFDVVFGSEEFEEFVGTDFIDGFGLFINGVNIAQAPLTDDPGDGTAPVNINHPAMDFLPGTELDGILAPAGNPLLSFSQTLVNPQGPNTLTFIIADTSDATLDSTAYISSLRAAPPLPEITAVTDTVTALAFGPDTAHPEETAAYAVVREDQGGGLFVNRLLKVDYQTPTDLDRADLDTVQEVSSLDMGTIEVGGLEFEVRGMDFDDQGRLIAQTVTPAGEAQRILIDLADPSRSTLLTTIGQDPEGVHGLTSNAGSSFWAVDNNDGANDRLIAFEGVNDRLVEIDPETGDFRVVGEIVDNASNPYVNNVSAIAFGPDGSLFALLNDKDGSGETFDRNDGAALARIEITDPDEDGLLLAFSPDENASSQSPALLDADPDPARFLAVTDPLNALAVDPFGRLYAVRHAGGQDFLLTIGDTDTHPVTGGFGVDVAPAGPDGGLIQVEGADTNILGIGFDPDGNLQALNNDGDSAEVIALPFGFDLITQRENDGGFATGQFTRPNDTELTPGGFVSVNGTIGDNFASTAADQDVFRIENVAGGQQVTVDVRPSGGTSPLDPQVALYDAAGNLIAQDDNSGTQSASSLTVTIDPSDAGDIFVVVSGVGTPIDPTFNPNVSAPLASRGGYTAVIGLDAPDTTQFQFTTVPGVLDPAIDSFGVGSLTGNTFAYDSDDSVGGTFFVSPSLLAPLPRDFAPANLIGSTIPGGGLGADSSTFDIRGLAVADRFALPDRYFAVNFNAQADEDATNDAFEIIEILRDGPNGEVSGIGQRLPIVDPRLPGPNIVREIGDIASESAGTIFVVGRSGESTAQELFQINPVTGQAASVATLNDGRTVQEPIVGLAFDPGNNLFAVRDLGEEGQELVRIDATTGSVTRIGLVRVAGDATDIRGLDFDPQGNLFATEVGTGGQRVIEIDIDDPGASTAITSFGGINENLRGYASDDDGEFFSIYNDQSVPSQLWVSPDRDRAVTLGRVDANGDFTQLLALAQDFDGTPLSSPVAGMTVDTVSGSVFVATQDGRLFEYSAADGQLVAQFGRVLDAQTGLPLNITALQVNGDGDLITVDSSTNQLYRIDTDSTSDEDGDGLNDRVAASTVGEPGSFDPTLIVDLAFDATGDRLVGVTNDPASFVAFAETPGGIYATSVDRLDIENPDGGFSGRVVTTGNSIGTVNVDVRDAFTGTIATAGDIQSFNQLNGDFAGTLSAADDIGSVNIKQGGFLAGGAVQAGGLLNSLNLNGSGALFGGSVTALEAGTLRFSGPGLDTARIDVVNHARSIDLGGSYEGDASIGAIDTLAIRGAIGSDSEVLINGPAGKVTIGGGTARGSVVDADGAIGTLTVGGTHRGQIATQQEIVTARFNNIDTALVAIGTDNRSFTASGDVNRSVISFGVWVGEDGVYNTDDDTIFGGTAVNVSIGGDYTSSVAAAGVLPTMDRPVLEGSPNLPLFTQDYSGFQVDAGPLAPSTFADEAEAGGILRSIIGNLSIRGNINNASLPSGAAVAVAADRIDRVTGPTQNLIGRAYGDPYGAPTVEGIGVVNDSEFRITFSEELNTASVVLARDFNNDGDVDDAGDTRGTVLLTDNEGNVVDDVDLVYSVEELSDGSTRGVLTVIRQEGFIGLTLSVELAGGEDGERAIFDRSGGRSSLRDFNLDGVPAGLETAFGGDEPTIFGEDPFGTILDGDRNRIEGGSAQFINFSTDVSDDFETSLEERPLLLPLNPDEDFTRITLGNTFEVADDVDVYHFQADAFDFMSVRFLGNPFAQMGVFVRDDQGTDEPDDDTFELISSYEQNIRSLNPLLRFDDGAFFQAVELPPIPVGIGSPDDLLSPEGGVVGEADGLRTANLDYFVVVRPLAFGETDDQSYELTITVAESDDLLDGVADDRVALPPEEQIAYISNFVGQRNNELGANAPKQLVYLNLSGGVATDTDPRASGQPEDFTFDAFDAAVLDPTLAGFTDVLLNNGVVEGQIITGIIQNILTIFSDTPGSNPMGGLNVQFVGEDLTPFASALSGLFFTTIDPAASGLDPDTDFATVFLGRSNVPEDASLFGIAEHVDLANLDKGDQAIILAESFAGVTRAPDLPTKLNDYSVALANVISHELGHLLGLNHTETPLFNDDPDNDPSTFNDANRGQNVMTSGGNTENLLDLERLGSSLIEGDEFPIGDIDNVDALLLWLGAAV